MRATRQFHWGRLLVQLSLLALFAIISLNYEVILDDYALATFHPPADVAAVESRLGLTTQARATFYRSSPQIDAKTVFNQDCNTKPHELELGCYYRGHIYVLRIDNQSLASEMDVVTAHELLHAVWNRMGASERKKLGEELERVYAGLVDKDLSARMASYAVSEPGEQTNELHSILGTEFANLTPTLEAHYAKLFINRGQIVAAHAAYTGVFTTRKTELENELAQIRAQKGQLGSLNRLMESYKNSGQVSAYNNLVPRQNRLVDDINNRIEAYRAAVDEYNALSKSLDSQEITDTEAPAQ